MNLDAIHAQQPPVASIAPTVSPGSDDNIFDLEQNRDESPSMRSIARHGPITIPASRSAPMLFIRPASVGDEGARGWSPTLLPPKRLSVQGFAGLTVPRCVWTSRDDAASPRMPPNRELELRDIVMRVTGYIEPEEAPEPPTSNSEAGQQIPAPWDADDGRKGIAQYKGP